MGESSGRRFMVTVVEIRHGRRTLEARAEWDASPGDTPFHVLARAQGAQPASSTPRSAEPREAHQTKLQFPTTPSAMNLQADELERWEETIADAIAAGDLWEGFAGLDARGIINAPGVVFEEQALRVLGVMGAIEHVLRCGPTRCRAVREWWKKEKPNRPDWKNPIGVLVETLTRHPHETPRVRRKHA